MAEFPVDVLSRVANRCETPCYVYLLDPIRQRFGELKRWFGDRFDVSYAVKANPLAELLRGIRDHASNLDCSSIAEVERGLAMGYSADRLTFSGPAKRISELQRAVELRIGSMICESVWEMEQLNQIAGKDGCVIEVLPRINPRSMPRSFGVSMAGKPSQFGIDEEEMESALKRLADLPNLDLGGFHIYSGTNSLEEEAISENFSIFIDLFRRFSEAANLQPRKLIFGSGFGIPYHDDETPLNMERLASLINPQIDGLKSQPRFRETRCCLEMGRWLVGSHGFLLTRVVNHKSSRGTDIYLCDAGFNNQLSACGMMGAIIRRNWSIAKITLPHDGPRQPCTLTGPLCTTIDQIATSILLPRLQRGDVIAIGSSGAYGLTASPTRFISHPEPREYLVTQAPVFDLVACGK